MQYALKLTPKQRYEAFPYQLLLFTIDNFDPELLEATRSLTPDEKSVYLRKLAFTLGSFILPKQMMKSFKEPADIFSKEVITEEEQERL